MEAAGCSYRTEDGEKAERHCNDVAELGGHREGDERVELSVFGVRLILYRKECATAGL